MREKPGEREASRGRGESRERRVELRERSSRGRGGGDAGVRQGETVRESSKEGCSDLNGGRGANEGGKK